MEIDQLLRTEIQLMFLDWGLGAEIVERHRSYDVQAGEVSESRSTFPVTVVLMKRGTDHVRGLAAGLHLVRRQFLVREQEIPAGIELTSAQLLLREVPYEIRSWSHSEYAGVVTLDCVGAGLESQGVADVD